MIRVIKRAAEIIFHNFLWKLLSLAGAIVIWALVATEPELTTMATVRLEYKNLPDGLEISSEPSANSVILELSGPSGALREVGESSHPAVVLDMAEMTSGEHSISIASRNVKLARGVHMVRSIPPVVRFNFEPRQTSSVPVHVRFLNDGQNSTRVTDYRVEPSELIIAGPRSRVARIVAVSADAIDVGRASGTAQFHTNAFTEDSFVRFVGAPDVTVTVTVKKK
jgi:YbbR domain-containing protein